MDELIISLIVHFIPNMSTPTLTAKLGPQTLVTTLFALGKPLTLPTNLHTQHNPTLQAGHESFSPNLKPNSSNHKHRLCDLDAHWTQDLPIGLFIGLDHTPLNQAVCDRLHPQVTKVRFDARYDLCTTCEQYDTWEMQSRRPLCFCMLPCLQGWMLNQARAHLHVYSIVGSISRSAPVAGPTSIEISAMEILLGLISHHWVAI